MPRRLALAAALLCLSAITSAAADHPAKAVMDADRAFAVKAKEVGLAKAFQMFAADKVVMFSTATPEMTPEQVAALFPPGFDIDWAPEGGAISDDGTLGYTWGKARYSAKKPGGTVTDLGPTRYVTIWRKQKDGSWKFIGDGELTNPETRAFQKK
ncbi:nuclear transport factor 2 family protein [Aerophototrophica crusticola]|uniref:Nuclear transport factor 2 family protein n=1 Tax=Aerophototrophica crusticola TaxID=1709002 RepID=A0A858R8U2_9PROT|nr:nuclear transport factor 2 family protein [Rhodospirillaceae bacterium B3]